MIRVRFNHIARTVQTECRIKLACYAEVPPVLADESLFRRQIYEINLKVPLILEIIYKDLKALISQTAYNIYIKGGGLCGHLVPALRLGKRGA